MIFIHNDFYEKLFKITSYSRDLFKFYISKKLSQNNKILKMIFYEKLFKSIFLFEFFEKFLC
jgi:hypothetical protein